MVFYNAVANIVVKSFVDRFLVSSWLYVRTRLHDYTKPVVCQHQPTGPELPCRRLIMSKRN